MCKRSRTASFDIVEDVEALMLAATIATSSTRVAGSPAVCVGMDVLCILDPGKAVYYEH